MTVDKSMFLQLYRKMFEIRRFEEMAVTLYQQGQIPGVLHPYIGEEAVAVGVCQTLQKTDYIVSNHRGHGHSIAKGVPPKFIMAELLAKETGICKGIGGSMHSTDTENGVLFSTAIVGGGVPIATGVALSLQYQGKSGVVACFFGDGATNTGSFHEGVNLAALWQLPVLFVCENNMYAISTRVDRSVAAKRIVDRANAYGIPGISVDGMDVLAVYDAASQAVERARKGSGPTLIECRTYRYKGHGAYDPGLGYRTKEEIQEWMSRDPIENLRRKLLQERLATENELKGIEIEVEKLIQDAVDFAQHSPPPAASKELLMKMVYA